MTRHSDNSWALSPLSLLIFGLFGGQAALADTSAAENAALGDVQFNPVFINQNSNGKKVDLSRFNQMGGAFPGNYRADVYANSVWIGRRDVQMKELAEGKVLACFNRAMMDELGVDFTKVGNAAGVPGRDEPARCVDIATVVPGAFSSFNSSDLRLDVSIPQKYMRAQARGYVAPEYWDAGAPFAGFLNYNANGYRYDNGAAGKSTQYYFGANAGLNIGLWRFRYNGSLTQQDSGNGQSQRNYQGASAYTQRDVTDWHSVLTLGDYFTPSDMFSSVPFRGVQLSSDDRMLPESMQGYAPVVRGVAETNAKVSIRQNGNLIYENVVPPGEFSIDDLYNTGFSGDLEVTVTEADGRVRKFVVPYAAVPQLLREGQSRYAITAAQWRDNSLNKRPDFVQATYQRGISNSLTLYGGLIAADHYQSALFGSGVNTPLGALALDVTQSWARNLPYNASAANMQGQSYRVTYSKLMESTRTNFTVAAYRFSTDGYLELRDYANLINQVGVVYRAKNKFQLNADQPLGEGRGQLFFTGSTQDYWNQKGRDLTYQLGYSNSFKSVSLNLSAGRTQDSTGRIVNQYMLSLSMPLGREPYSPLLSTSVSGSSDRSGNAQVNLSGTTGELRNLSYNVYASGNRSSAGANSSGGGGSVQYATSVATLTAGASSSGGNSQANAGISGALVFHPGGVTAAQSLGESFAVVEAPGAEGAAVSNTNGVRVNKNGYAVVSSLMPYRRNEITLDPKGMDQDVELQETSVQDAPRAGAIVMLKFNTQQGKPVIVTLKRPDGSHLPVGATVSGGDDFLTMVGQGGRAFLRGVEGKPLTASWGSDAGQQCRFSYQLPQKTGDAAYMRTDAVCEPL
ncbi:fimbria/pilus outer membrane usher protein [Chromobacterium piscinae]|uniref:fimbria/pilus outer membrane usher protein n=1 Tax=Chromobacterium piscinae TaxID=686831 RepID=UPI001C8BDE2D|nr:fimbria/pilus outer membrane usher protein [Chromobacterium piscinae]MBX9347397.1 fimbrial biogenesis outer membrane usher protein [Chromobacterium vaccinii]MCD4504870.1 fimbrial biogenesis outer membrane usher protein [Chromobacterium piscinae]MCD5327736.1 fimbrial biogenesis outer membrane usher protein [Chromobacterium piscinae]